MKNLLFLSITLLMTSLLYADKNAIVLKDDTSNISAVSQQFPLNVGFINSFEIMTGCKKGKEIREVIAKKESEFQQKLLAEESELNKLRENYRAKVTSGMVDTEAASLRVEKRKLEDREEAYKVMVRGMQEDLNAMVQELTAELSQIVEVEVEQFAKQHKFEVVFDLATGRIVYCASHLNKTAALTTLVDNKTVEKEKDAATKVATNNKKQITAA